MQEVASFLGIGKQQARKYLASLEGKGICRKLNSYKPVTFKLTEEFIQSNEELIPKARIV